MSETRQWQELWGLSPPCAAPTRTAHSIPVTVGGILVFTRLESEAHSLWTG